MSSSLCGKESGCLSAILVCQVVIVCYSLSMAKYSAISPCPWTCKSFPSVYKSCPQVSLEVSSVTQVKSARNMKPWQLSVWEQRTAHLDLLKALSENVKNILMLSYDYAYLPSVFESMVAMEMVEMFKRMVFGSYFLSTPRHLQEIASTKKSTRLFMLTFQKLFLQTPSSNVLVLC